MSARYIPILFILLWPTGFIGAKLGAPHSEPFTFLAVRFWIVALLLAIICVVWRVRWPSGAAARDGLIAGVLLHGVYLGGVFWAIDNGLPVGLSALIVALQPLLTATLAGPVLGESVRPMHWVGLAVGLCGTVLVLWPGLTVGAPGVNAATLGAVIVSLGAITVGTIFQKRTAADVDLRVNALFQYIGAGALAAAGAFAFETRVIDWAPEFVFALAWLIFVLSLGAISLLMLMIRENAVSRVASLFYLVPVCVALWAWALFGETLLPVQIVGMVAIVAALALIARVQPQPEAVPKAAA